jgi:NADPH2:quinone reductase
MQMFNDGKIKPRISGRYPLEEAAKALREMSDRKVKGKVILTTGRDAG